MADGKTVLKSVNTPDGGRCVDLFRRGDGGYGFEEYRRDIEDGRGWFAIGGHGDAVFANEDEALAAALAAVPWLASAMPGS